MSTLEQSRHLATAIPGPKSQQLIDRKAAAVSRGVGTTMPVYAARAQGGIVEDVDGNRLIDLGSGIAVTTICNAAPRVVEAVAAELLAELAAVAAPIAEPLVLVIPYVGFAVVPTADKDEFAATYTKHGVEAYTLEEARANIVAKIAH